MKLRIQILTILLLTVSWVSGLHLQQEAGVYNP
jgi:hypothetical protein